MSKKIALRIAAPVVIAGALFGLAGGAQAMASVGQVAPKPAAAMAHLTQGFEIRNLSSHDIVLQGIVSPGNGDGKPDIGTVLRPGDAVGYQTVFWFGNTSHTALQFSENTGHSQTLFEVELWVDPFLNIPSVMTHGATGAGDILFSGTGNGSKNLTFLDQPGAAAIQVSPQDKQKQADLLNRLCVGGQAACTFAPTKSVAGPDSIQRRLTDKNIGTTTLTINFKEAFTFGTTTSVEVTGSAKTSLLGMVEVTLAGKYGQGWSQTRTDEITRSFPVPSGRLGIIEVIQPTIRQYGTFSVTMGNSKWELTDVYFDIPDKTKAPVVHAGDIAA